MNNLIEKEAQQTHLSQELIFEEDQSLPGMFLHSEKQKYYFRTVSACYWGWGVKNKKNAVVEIVYSFPCREVVLALEGSVGLLLM